MSEVASIHDRKAFDGQRQLAWDSTSLGAFKRCPHYYKLTILEGWRGKEESPHLKFGTLLHSAVELIDHARVNGELTDDTLIIALRQAMESAGHRDPETGVFRPWLSSDSNKNTESLVRTIIWYFDHYLEDAFKVDQLANGKAAVELSFRYDLPLEIGGERLLYCGHLDSIGTFAGQHWVLDRKTTKSYLNEQFFKQFSPNLQMTGYTVAGKLGFAQPVEGVIVDAMQIGVTFTRFARAPVTFTNEQLEEWLVNTTWTIQQALRHVEAGFFPLNENACSMYGGCPMQTICSKTPSVRQRFLTANFKQVGWDPLTPRGVE